MFETVDSGVSPPTLLVFTEKKNRPFVELESERKRRKGQEVVQKRGKKMKKKGEQARERERKH